MLKEKCFYFDKSDSGIYFYRHYPSQVSELDVFGNIETLDVEIQRFTEMELRKHFNQDGERLV